MILQAFRLQAADAAQQAQSRLTLLRDAERGWNGRRLRFTFGRSTVARTVAAVVGAKAHSQGLGPAAETRAAGARSHRPRQDS